MTIRELFREFAVAAERTKDDAKAEVRKAWHVARITAQMTGERKIRPLDEYLPRERPMTQPQIIAEQRRALETLSAQYGIPLRKASPKANGQ